MSDQVREWNQVQNSFQNDLDWQVVFSFGNPLEQTKVATKKFVTQAWECGKMPFLVNERQWIVGVEVRKTFFGSSVIPIIVGPKKPRLCRERYYREVKVERGV